MNDSNRERSARRNSTSNGSRKLPRRRFLEAAGATGVASLFATAGGAAQSTPTESNGGECRPGTDTDGDPTATWSREAARQIERTDDNTAPVIDELNNMAPNLWVWDSWPLRNKDGSVACIDGWTVMFSLTSPDALLPGKRHDVAEIRYFYSKDGQDWQLGGPIFEPDRPLGNRQWASSAVVDEDTGEVTFFYTAVGDEDNLEDTYPPVDGLTYEQRLAVASGVQVTATDSGVDFERRWQHDVILTADGDLYQTREQAGQGIIYSFRDPWYFQDQDTGCEYLLFEGNTPVDPSEVDCQQAQLDDGDYLSGVAAGGANFNGNIGLAVNTADGLPGEWELLPPLLDAVCVNQQLERGNLIVEDGSYYLFFDSHQFTFAPDLSGPDGLYGFVADSLHGDYAPLNDSGLVVANPEEQPFQAYSWMPVPYDEQDRIAVLSYYNYHDLGDRTLKEVGGLSPEQQREVFGGTLAPTLVVELDDAQTEIVDTLPPGYLPSECTSLEEAQPDSEDD